MVDSRIIVHWSLKVNDWVSTSKSVSTERYHIGLIGCRNGEFIIVNSFGAIQFAENYDAWIGAIDYTIEEDSLVVFIATKTGDVHKTLIDLKTWMKYDSQIIFQTNNTIREIRFIPQKDARKLIIVGEDKFLRLFELGDTLEVISVDEKKYNGWLRCMELLPNEQKQLVWVAVGCGDKNIHFYNIITKEEYSLFIGYKTHSIKYIHQGGQLLSSNDGNKLLVINWKLSNRINPRVNKTINTPQRIKTIETIDSSWRILLLLGDFKSIFTFNLTKLEIIQCKYFSKQIHSLESFKLEHSERFLIGFGTSELLSISYPFDNVDLPSLRYIEDQTKGNSLLYIDTQKISDKFEAEHINAVHDIFCGKVLDKYKIGIGRFIFIYHYVDENYILVSTDEGAIFIFRHEHGKLIELRNKMIDDARAWSLGVNESKTANPEKSRGLLIGTSNSEIIEINWEELIEGGEEWAIQQTYKLNDWAREIRMSNFEKSSNYVSIGCENGDIAIIKNSKYQSLFNAPFTIRSICNFNTSGKDFFVVGTDQNLAICYDYDGNETWKLQTSDRVREIRLIDNFIWIASEDRFLYKVTLEGILMGLLKFPHRVLCISSFSLSNDLSLFIGCGDGNVYEISKNLKVKDCYRCFDRIRDIEVLTEEHILVVASEDRFLYLFHIKSFDVDYNTDEFAKHSDEFSHSCNLNLTSGNEDFLNALCIEDKYYLLRTRNLWYVENYIQTLLYLIDSLIEDKRIIDVLDISYEIASCILNEILDFDYRACLSRLEKVMQIQNDYFIHAIWTSIFEVSNNSNRNIIVRISSHTLSSMDDFQYDWLNIEISRILREINFFSLNNLSSISSLNKQFNSKILMEVYQNYFDWNNENANTYISNFNGTVSEQVLLIQQINQCIINKIDPKKHITNFQSAKVNDDVKEILSFYIMQQPNSNNGIISLLLKHYFQGVGKDVSISDFLVLYQIYYYDSIAS